jgi:hypothetical protein
VSQAIAGRRGPFIGWQGRNNRPHDPDSSSHYQAAVMVVLSFMKLLNNWQVSLKWEDRGWNGDTGAWLIGFEEMRSNADLIMAEIGVPRCSCDSCLRHEDTAVRKSELAFAGFREYVEACPPPTPVDPNKYYDLAFYYLHSALEGHLPHIAFNKEGR